MSTAVGTGSVLRRADWRYLLPGPPGGSYRHLVLLGGPEELAERLRERGVALRVSRSVPPAGTADALVILYDARIEPADAAACLRAGGAFYLEIDRLQPGRFTWSPARLDRKLRQLGLNPGAMYWVLPGFRRATCYCPLFQPSALRWCLQALFPALTIRRRLLRSLARAVLGRRKGGTAPPGVCYGVTGVAGSDADQRPSVVRSEGLPARASAAGLSFLLFTHGRDDFGRVVLLPFSHDSKTPLAVLKVGRFPARNARTEHEQAVLAEIRGKLDRTRQDVVPQPLGLARWGELTIGVESCAPGQLLSTVHPGRLGRRRHFQNLELVTDWLGELHTRARVGWVVCGAPEIDQWFEAPVAEYERCLQPGEGERRLFTTVRERAALMLGSRIPVVWEHYDLGTWNIYRSGPGIHVVDWESSTPKLPLSDLLYFVTYWDLTARGARSDREYLIGFERLFCGGSARDPLTAAAHHAVAAYSARLALDPRWYPLLLVRLWVVHSIGMMGRARILGEDPGDGRAGNRYVQYVEILGRHRERLFGAITSTAPVSAGRVSRGLVR